MVKSTASVLRGGLRAIKRTLKRALRHNYSAYRLYYHLRLLISSLSSSTEIVIYQMGKVGSVTLTRSFQGLPNRFAIHKVHSLTDSGIERMVNIYRHDWPSTRTRMTHVWESEYLRQRLSNRKQWKVVTLTRDPIARNVSDFFQVMDLKFGISRRSIQSPSDAQQKAKELVNLFLNTYEGHDVPLNWFDTELKDALDIDVYDYRFPKNSGYQIIETESFRLLILKLETLDSCATQAMSDWLGLNDFEVIRGNLGHDSYYSVVYSEFFNVLELPHQYVDRMYSSKYARHFYTEVELATFRSRWHIS